MDTKFCTRSGSGGMFFADHAVQCEGRFLWVSSTATNAEDATTHGESPELPFATLVYAETAASTGDTIYVLPGHAETLTGNPSLTLDVVGLRVIGLGGWSRRPTFLIDGASTAHILISGADTLLQNVELDAGHEDVAKAIDVKAKGVTIRKVFINEITTDENFKIGINVGTADNDCDGLLIEDCVIYQPDAANTNAIWFVKDQDHCTVRGNQIQGDYVADSAIIGSPGTELFQNLAVTDNLIDNDANDSVHVIEFAGATNTGIIARNLSGDLDEDGTPFVGTGMTLCENYHTGAVTKSGFIYPAIP